MRSARRHFLAALLAFSGSPLAAFEIPFLYLEGPSGRSNPFDPKNPSRPTATPLATLAFPSATVSPTQTPSPSASATPTDTPYQSATPTFTASPVYSDTASPTASPAYSDTPSPTASPAFSDTPSPSPSATPTATVTPAVNGVWPLLSNFEGDEFGNSAQGVNASFDDNGDGCGSSASSTAFSRTPGASYDGSACLRFDYNVATNAGCGYEYAAFSMPLLAPQDISAYNGLRFYVKGAAGGETFRLVISTGAYVDPCLGSRNELRYVYSATTTSWQLVQIPFSAFTNKNAGCPYLPSMAANTQALQMVAFSVGSGTIYIDEPAFAVLSVPSNGVWPVVSIFEADATSNNAGGTQFSGDDNEEGCGPSLSAEGYSRIASGSWDVSDYCSLSYTVDTNIGCGYEYVYFGFDCSGQPDLTPYSGLRFYARDSSAQTIKVQLQANVVDVCAGYRNKMHVWLPLSASWTFYDLPFATFTDRYAGCPFIGGGWLSQVSDLTFILVAVSSGTLDLDQIEYY